MELIDGRRIAAAITADAKKLVATLPREPGLAVVLVGDDPASRLYVQLKEKACREVGIAFTKTLLPANTRQEEILAAIQAFNERSDVHGILVQLPLPGHLNEDEVIASIDPAKDADGFHPETRRRFLAGDAAVMPPLVRAIDRLLAATGEPLAGKTAVVIAHSPVFAQPVIHQLTQRGVSASHVKSIATPPTNYQLQTTNYKLPTTNPAKADILIVALGRPGVISADDVKAGAIVVDVGTTRREGKILGDVDADSVKTKAAWLSPVPGGVGPVTVAALLERIVTLAARIKGR